MLNSAWSWNSTYGNMLICHMSYPSVLQQNWSWTLLTSCKRRSLYQVEAQWQTELLAHMLEYGLEVEHSGRSSGTSWALLFWTAIAHWSYTGSGPLPCGVLCHHIILKIRMIKMREMGRWSRSLPLALMFNVSIYPEQVLAGWRAEKRKEEMHS